MKIGTILTTLIAFGAFLAVAPAASATHCQPFNITDPVSGGGQVCADTGGASVFTILCSGGTCVIVSGDVDLSPPTDPEAEVYVCTLNAGNLECVRANTYP